MSIGGGGRRPRKPDAANASRKRRSHLKRTYGLTPEEYEQLYAAQHGRCAICDKSQDTLCVDHCHTTGAVRGLLCRQCNLILGFAEDEPKRLRDAAHYLEDI